MDGWEKDQRREQGYETKKKGMKVRFKKGGRGGRQKKQQAGE